MKSICRSLVWATVGLFVFSGANQVQAQDTKIMAALRLQYETTGGEVFRLAEAIPENKYDFRPTPEVRSFRELIQHLVQENNNYLNIMLDIDTGDQGRFEKLQNRTELLQALKESYDRGNRVLATMTDTEAVEIVSIAPDARAGIRGQQKTKWSIIMAVLLDNMGHYGNLVVYARLNGIVPPRTVARQQRRQQN